MGEPAAQPLGRTALKLNQGMVDVVCVAPMCGCDLLGTAAKRVVPVDPGLLVGCPSVGHAAWCSGDDTWSRRWEGLQASRAPNLSENAAFGSEVGVGIFYP